MPLKLVKRHGSPNYYIRGTVRGQSVDESAGTSDKDAAEAIRAKREWEITQGSVFGRRASATFLEAAVGHMEAGGSRRYLDKLVKHFGATKLSEVDQAAVNRAASTLYPNRAPATIARQVFAPMSAVLTYAAENNLREAITLTWPKLPRGKTRWLKHAEAAKLINACGDHLRPLVAFLFYTGARLSEALYLDWREVDLQRAHVTLVDTKNGEDRGVPLHPVLVAMLASINHRDGRVFRRPDGEPYAEKNTLGGGQIKTGFRAACRRAGIVDFTPHDCRHTWATWHYAANRNVFELMELGGWKTERMVRRYTHINKANLAEGVSKLPDLPVVGSGENPGTDKIQYRLRRRKTIIK